VADAHKQGMHAARTCFSMSTCRLERGAGFCSQPNRAERAHRLSPDPWTDPQAVQLYVLSQVHGMYYVDLPALPKAARKAVECNRGTGCAAAFLRFPVKPALSASPASACTVSTQQQHSTAPLYFLLPLCLL
jgi:hypothetical protein